MSTNVATFPVAGESMLPAVAVDHRHQPAALRVMLDEALFERAQRFARMIANAKGIVPQHLLGEEAVCFSVVLDSLDSGLSPYFLAQNTFPVKTWDKKANAEILSGIGYQGKLIRARMEASGYFESIDYVYEGDWSKVQGKWKWTENDRGRKFQSAAYTDADEVGLVIVLRAKFKGRAEVTEYPMEMRQMWPRNSTLWATDPKTQAAYVILRRFCSLYASHVLGGMRFEDDFAPPEVGPDYARDVTPKADRAAARRAAMEELETVEVVDAFGAVAHVMPGEVEAWARGQLDGATPEQAEELAANNPGIELFQTHMHKVGTPPQQPKVAPATNGKTVTIVDAEGEVVTTYASYGEAVAGLKILTTEYPSLPRVEHNRKILEAVAKSDKAPDDVRETAQKLLGGDLFGDGREAA